MLDFHQKTPFTCIQACCVWLLDPTAASSHRSPCVASGEEQRVPEGLTAKQRARRGRSRERGAERGGLVAKINRKMVKYSTARAAPILRRQTVKPRGGKALKGQRRPQHGRDGETPQRAAATPTPPGTPRPRRTSRPVPLPSSSSSMPGGAGALREEAQSSAGTGTATAPRPHPPRAHFGAKNPEPAGGSRAAPTSPNGSPGRLRCPAALTHLTLRGASGEPRCGQAAAGGGGLGTGTGTAGSPRAAPRCQRSRTEPNGAERSRSQARPRPRR